MKQTILIEAKVFFRNKNILIDSNTSQTNLQTEVTKYFYPLVIYCQLCGNLTQAR